MTRGDGELAMPIGRMSLNSARRFGSRTEAATASAVLLRLLLAALLATVWSVSAMAGRLVVDSAGRQVEVPDVVARIVAAGPPASVLMTILAPEKLIGWNRKPQPEELPYLPQVVRNLPEIGRLTGRGGTANLEVVMAAKPDLIVDFGSVSDTYISLADRVQNQTGIPYILVDGRFANTLSAVRLLGGILGVGPRAEELARRMEEILGDVDRITASVPPEKRPRVYLARGGRGLETGNRGSINTEIIERAGATNVVDGGLERGGLYNVSLEQVVAWNPDTVVTVDSSVADYIRSDASWSQIEAVRRGRVFLSPRLPYGWIDSPPSLNRLVGLQYMARLLYPGRHSDDIREVARGFYCQFYQVDLDDPALDRLLEGAQAPR
jgi:iron complex transport system substrate-binding protein